jgi:phosphatidylinositol glycan class W
VSRWHSRGISSDTFIQQANLPYVLWVTAYNSSFLLCYVLIYMIFLQPLQVDDDNDDMQRTKLQQSKTPLLLSSLNHSAMIVFLIANLLTGLINISIQTMYTSHFVAIIILTLYVSICLALATFVHFRGWKISF